ncbi:MAG: lipopolysaccharide kinase InaA family protein [Acidobacteriota bacterium]
MSEGPLAAGGTWPRRRFELDGWWGEVSSTLAPSSPEDRALLHRIERLVDPSHAVETVHWGRNYLYRTEIDTAAGDPVGVVVKQFRNQGTKRRVERRLKGSKAERSWRRALDFVDAGVTTAEPVAWIESTAVDGPSFFVTRHLADTVEARYIFRALADDRLAEAFPHLDREAFLDAIGEALRRMHAAGLFHRDLSIGNLLLPQGIERPTADDVAVIDLNRARRRRAVGLHERHRDLCRLTLVHTSDRRRFLRAYWGRGPSALHWLLYLAYHYGFYGRLAAKKAVRAPFRALATALKPRRAHVHIPQAPEGASARDKIVWDHLSDQPHQHAGRLEKLRVRLADLPSHLHTAAIIARAAPRVAQRHRALTRRAFARPRPWQGAGVCVRPLPEAIPGGTEIVRNAVRDLGVRHVLLRLHPWQEEHDAEEELARALRADGHELIFALPQTRELVRDRALWRRRIEHLATRFAAHGDTFQVGQAINRSKWGIWRASEYLDLAHDAVTILHREGLRAIGPAVIDFEPYATLGILHHPRCPRFDAAASLLYVDRRGAPENPQLGFDTVGKAALVRAIAETSNAVREGGGSWITEVNWPLWEGPHSPAGKDVSVDEEQQADYLVRYFVLALTSGMAERVYWWQLVARGYGLIAPRDAAGDAHGLRRRPAFQAMATMSRELDGARFLRRLETPDGAWLLLFGAADGGELAVGWSLRSSANATAAESTAAESTAAESTAAESTVAGRLPWIARRVVDRDGAELETPASASVELAPGVRYFRL